MIRLTILSVLFLASCVSPKPLALFDAQSSQEHLEGIGNFYALEIYSDYITDENWNSLGAPCLDVKHTTEVKRSGEASLHLKWDKNTYGCGFIGMGFGWDGWFGKNMESIRNEAAIEMWMKVPEGSKKTLPLAICLEDYSGRQAWLGFSTNAVVGDAITTDWTPVRLPLSEFDWDQFGADISNVKQMIIQFEADGETYVDDIGIIPFEGSFRKRAHIEINPSAKPIIDGKSDDWDEFPITMETHKVALKTDGDFLYAAAVVTDATPLQNSKSGDDIWNGDAFEIAFSSVPGSGKSVYLKSTDHHLGVRLNESPMVWDWEKHEQLEGASVSVSKTADGVFAEMAIPLNEIREFEFKPNLIYRLELAIDLGTKSGRTQQTRWNSEGIEGFHTNPKLWGEMIFKQSL